MPRGGARPGAGRPKGRLPGRAAEIAAARALGELPHEFLARIARGDEITLGVVTKKGKETPITCYPTLDQRIDAAKAAAPFFAPRLAQVEQKIQAEIEAVISSEPISEDEWARKYGNAGSLGAAGGSAEGPH